MIPLNSISLRKNLRLYIVIYKSKLREFGKTLVNQSIMSKTTENISESELKRRAKISASMKKLYSNKEYKEEWEIANANRYSNLSVEEREEKRKERSTWMSELWSDPEYKAKRSANVKQGLNNMSEEKRIVRSENMKKAHSDRTSEEKEIISSNISKGLLNYHAAMTEEEHEKLLARTSRGEKHSDATKNNHPVNRNEEDRIAFGKAVSDGRKNMTDEAKAKRSEKFGKAHAAWFSNLSEEEYNEWFEKWRNGKISSNNTKNKVMKIAGKDIRFDSSWEFILYKVLLSLNVNFYYANDNGNIYTLTNGHRYHPDFELPDYDIIIEVKAPFLLDAFITEKINHWDEKHKIYILDWNPMNYEFHYNTLNQLLDDLKLVTK